MILITLFSCKRGERTQPKLSDISESVYASGIIKSQNQYKVYAEVNGILQKKAVSRGDLVKQDQTLFIIENKTSELSTRNSEIAMNISRENLRKINDQKRQSELLKKIFIEDSLNYIRYQKLLEQNVGNKLDVEQKMLAYQQSKTNYLNSLNQTEQMVKSYNLELQRSKNNLQISREQQGDYIITSKTDAKIYDILIEEGESVTPQTPLALIGDPDHFIIEMQVDENDIIKVKTGQTIFVTLESYGDKVFKAKVSMIHPIMDEKTGTFTVEGIFTNEPKDLYPNLTLESNIVIRTKKNALIIPRDYLINDSYVLTERDKKVEVKIGLKNYEYVEILSGIDSSQYIYKP